MAASDELATGKRGAAVTPSDSTTYSGVRCLYVGVAGDITADLADGGTNLLFKAHPVGYALFQPTKIYATGTTATNMIALY